MYAIGLMSSSLQRATRFSWKLAKSSLGDEVFAPGEMVGHSTLIRDLYEPFKCLAPGMGGLEACESLFTHLEGHTYLVRLFLGIQQEQERGS